MGRRVARRKERRRKSPRIRTVRGTMKRSTAIRKGNKRRTGKL